jgi:penicillin-binding protein 1B
MGWEELGEKLGSRIPRFLKPLSEYPSQLLGAMELSMPEILALYEDFISVECSRPDWSVGPMGWLLDPTQTTLRRVIRPELKGIEFFSKTGTSNDGLDNLFLFYDGRWLGVIWFGIDGSREGLSGTNFFGSTTAFAIYQSFIMQRGKRFTEFECP